MSRIRKLLVANRGEIDSTNRKVLVMPMFASSLFFSSATTIWRAHSSGDIFLVGLPSFICVSTTGGKASITWTLVPSNCARRAWRS